ncbi:hypothetical protein [Lapillicoccus sp.]|uniref:hypothetical protein n=1 Tax=Lapillicoccus sp. TaxID=1909287 RepID=UPI0032635921
MIAHDRQADYVTYVDDTGVAQYRQAEGCRLSMILTRDLEMDPDTSESDSQTHHSTPRVEVIALSIWDSEAAIRAFAGPDINAMVLYFEDQDFLLEPPTLVHHQVDSFSLPAVQDTRGPMEEATSPPRPATDAYRQAAQCADGRCERAAHGAVPRARVAGRHAEAGRGVDLAAPEAR